MKTSSPLQNRQIFWFKPQINFMVNFQLVGPTVRCIDRSEISHGSRPSKAFRHIFYHILLHFWPLFGALITHSYSSVIQHYQSSPIFLLHNMAWNIRWLLKVIFCIFVLYVDRIKSFWCCNLQVSYKLGIFSISIELHVVLPHYNRSL